MDYAIETNRLGKRRARRWALAECTLTVPAGQVVGLVGPNGAGKTTFLELAAGLLRPTTGTITVRGRAGFVAQDAPVYAGLSVAGHLRMGQSLNDRWDAGLARRRALDAGLDPRQPGPRAAGTLLPGCGCPSWSSCFPACSGCSGAPRWWPANWSPARSG